MSKIQSLNLSVLRNEKAFGFLQQVQAETKHLADVTIESIVENFSVALLPTLAWQVPSSMPSAKWMKRISKSSHGRNINGLTYIIKEVDVPKAHPLFLHFQLCKNMYTIFYDLLKKTE